ncbi:SDR family NAD(P)-dependent oxidoreductase [Paenibacillus sp. 5J-6]|uniref:SDR family NAD(P)-dependent oxidoreductase n=1 Tax=Paenibacillus silvestris TaxID=2606219 RepID=A0A6L8V8I8_9BACL|nr:SDR family NAD(P)-dependent oxidoreductase [Paenibacillus silvestris]MZQ85966.1 SDR family NAD(P)-dependent oxidoreductase [Paenibacillus silvestris]
MFNDNQRTMQKPIPTNFGPRTTATEALGGQDLTGKVAIVTGGYSGLGLEVTRVLVKAGAKVIVPVRTPEKARIAVESIPGVELVSLDLMVPESIDVFAQRFLDSNRPLDILINAAAIMATPLTRDSRGNESQFATNHLGHFRLTARLWPALKKAEQARIVSVTSRIGKLHQIDLEDPNFEKTDYEKWMAYARSKLASSLFSVEMDKRGKAHGVRAFTVHPGTIITDLARSLSDDELRVMGALNEKGERALPYFNDEFKTIEEGAATIVWCAVNRQLDGMGGLYCENNDIAEVVAEDSNPFEAGVYQRTIDPVLAEKLWELSEKLIDLQFAI